MSSRGRSIAGTPARTTPSSSPVGSRVGTSRGPNGPSSSATARSRRPAVLTHVGQQPLGAALEVDDVLYGLQCRRPAVDVIGAPFWATRRFSGHTRRTVPQGDPFAATGLCTASTVTTASTSSGRGSPYGQAVERVTVMRSKWVAVAVLAAGLAIGPYAATAQAGQAKGHDINTLQCEDLGTIDISVQPSEDNWGAAQIVGTTGHLIPVRLTFTLEN